MKIGYGIATWDGQERRSNRYGAIHLDDRTHDEKTKCKVDLDTKKVSALRGQRVRMWAVVVEARKSDHLGDLGLREHGASEWGIEPTQPEVGERIDLGVGILGLDFVEWCPQPSLVLAPDDGRETFWLDPRKLYRLHDQTVDLFVEVTEDDFTAAPVGFESKGEGLATSTGESDGSFQVKGRMPTRIAPAVESLGDGMFIMSHTPQRGSDREILEFEDDMKNKYRKKPVVVEAFQMTVARQKDQSEWPVWLTEARDKPGDAEGSLTLASDGHYQIVTLEGLQLISWDDFIIQGVKGEIYPCKPDVFEATYDKV